MKRQTFCMSLAAYRYRSVEELEVGKSVSYTHLDVYKRQRIIFSDFVVQNLKFSDCLATRLYYFQQLPLFEKV